MSKKYSNENFVPKFFLLSAVSVAVCAGGCILSKMHPRSDAAPDYLVVLGARVYGTEAGELLQSRINGAREYLSAHPNTVAVLTGGKTEHAEITEAECMYRALTGAGISPERLIVENDATRTEENLLYAFMLIPNGASVGILSSDFHLFRADRLAKKLGYRVSLHAVPSPGAALPYAFLREIVAIVVEKVLGRI